jgi:hypothetical protein
MRMSKIYERGSCPICSGPLARKIEGTEPGRHELWTVCVGECRRRFSPPWLERHWGDPESRPIPWQLATAYPVVSAFVNGKTKPEVTTVDACTEEIIYDESGLPVAACIQARGERELPTLKRAGTLGLTLNDVFHWGIAACAAIVLMVSIVVVLFHSGPVFKGSSLMAYILAQIPNTLI